MSSRLVLLFRILRFGGTYIISLLLCFLLSFFIVVALGEFYLLSFPLIFFVTLVPILMVLSNEKRLRRRAIVAEQRDRENYERQLREREMEVAEELRLEAAKEARREQVEADLRAREQQKVLDERRCHIPEGDMAVF